MPYFPLGFTEFGAGQAACGLKTADKIYLAVWNFDGVETVCVPIFEKVRLVSVGYPKTLETDFKWTENTLTVSFPHPCSACFFEIELCEGEG